MQAPTRRSRRTKVDNNLKIDSHPKRTQPSEMASKFVVLSQLEDDETENRDVEGREMERREMLLEKQLEMGDDHKVVLHGSCSRSPGRSSGVKEANNNITVGVKEVVVPSKNALNLKNYVAI
ncbi:hypothetical protein V6N13_015040 [Hibiscus sabdariffa]|uniref:Uncharacterized protein n=1 Tax=Hibiscus sabdariffa TaxID=183260 RepID=A0ABR2RXR1_9ROSI